MFWNTLVQRGWNQGCSLWCSLASIVSIIHLKYSMRSQQHAVRGYHVSKLQHGNCGKIPSAFMAEQLVCMFKKNK